MPFGDVFKRMGKTRTKVTFFIEVQTLVITSISGLDSGDDLNVLFERGDKSVSTAPKTLTESKKDKNLTANFSEILRLDATMYKDSHGNFQVTDRSDKMYILVNNSYFGTAVATCRYFFHLTHASVIKFRLSTVGESWKTDCETKENWNCRTEIRKGCI
jgi:hypothetical protein